jgi:Protein of unknown function (DUF3431)
MPSTELVVARFNENIDWSRDLGVAVRVYDKGPYGGLPNVGREAHTYLHHVVSRYDSLADWTVFCQGDPLPHLNGTDLEALLTPPSDAGADPIVVPWHVTLREWDDRGRLRWHEWPAWAVRYANGEIRKAQLPLPEWLLVWGLVEAMPPALTYHPGAIFGVSKERIRSRPREFYEGLLRQVSDHPHPEEAHYLERAWPLVFGGPLVALTGMGLPQAPPRTHKVFVAVPHYDQLAPQALNGLMLCTDKHNYHIRCGGGSLLAMGFNALWCAALNSRAEHGWTHFSMHHSDLEAPPGWLDVLLDEMDRVGADLLSVCVPIKDQRGLTSTGWQDPETGAVNRLTMAEVMKLPETFSAADLGKERLMVNTGLFVCDFTKPWAEEHSFKILDTITRGPDGRFRPRTLPEDWGFSAWLADRGLRVFATRKVPVVHYGKTGFRNDSAWGEWQTDLGDDNRERKQPAAAA